MSSILLRGLALAKMHTHLLTCKYTPRACEYVRVHAPINLYSRSCVCSAFLLAWLVLLPQRNRDPGRCTVWNCPCSFLVLCPCFSFLAWNEKKGNRQQGNSQKHSKRDRHLTGCRYLDTKMKIEMPGHLSHGTKNRYGVCRLKWFSAVCSSLTMASGSLFLLQIVLIYKTRSSLFLHTDPTTPEVCKCCALDALLVDVFWLYSHESSPILLILRTNWIPRLLSALTDRYSPFFSSLYSPTLFYLPVLFISQRARCHMKPQRKKRR